MSATRPPRIREDAFPEAGPWAAQAEFLLRFAVLAPSSHNSQPWIFDVEGPLVDVRADLDRWLRVADANQRELYVSLGCALETLVVAADRFGLVAEVELFPDPTDTSFAARVRLAQRPAGAARDYPDDVFEAIQERRTDRGSYDGEAVSEADRARLEAKPLEEETAVHFTSDAEVRRRVDELTVRADALQFADPEWRHELAHWLGQGAFGTGWLVSKVSQLAVHHLDLSKSVGRKDRELLDSASLLGVVTTSGEGHEAELQAGRTLQRLWLTATALGLAIQPMNQVLQVPEVRDDFEALLPDAWGVPKVTFRLGHGLDDEAPSSPRRALNEVMGSGSQAEAGS